MHYRSMKYLVATLAIFVGITACDTSSTDLLTPPVAFECIEPGSSQCENPPANDPTVTLSVVIVSGDYWYRAEWSNLPGVSYVKFTGTMGQAYGTPGQNNYIQKRGPNQPDCIDDKITIDVNADLTYADGNNGTDHFYADDSITLDCEMTPN